VLISDQYRAQLRQMHEAGKFAASSGQKHMSTILFLLKKTRSHSILDYGCGTSGSVGVVGDVVVAEYDPAVPGKEDPPVPADMVVCTDVLEHVEPDNLRDVLDHLHALTIKVCFAVIATRPADKRLPDGRNAHLIIDNASWWVQQIRQYEWTVWINSLAGGELVVWMRKDNLPS
jgi:hypothetical protein